MIYTGDSLKEISFPLGGIGTGSIGLSGIGRLMDWEIFNNPNKGSINGYTHIAVKETVGGEAHCRILQGDWQKDLTGTYMQREFLGFGFGPARMALPGFPHFKNCEFHGEFPVATIKFTDEAFQGEVYLTAFNPFIPLDSFNSSIPAAFFEITYKNTGDSPVEFESVFSLGNPFPKTLNKAVNQGNYSEIILESAQTEENDKDYGQLCLACEDPSQVQPYWYRGGWQDGIVTFWNEFTSNEGLKYRIYDEPVERNDAGVLDTCSLGKKVCVEAGESKSLRFILTWNVPNVKYWWPKKLTEGQRSGWKNYYATIFKDAGESAEYCLKNWDDLYDRTMEYKNELFASTVDPVILDAVSATVSVLKSPTVYRLENGEFYGFEGVHERQGSCEGTCQHVYNYAYALCFLFPDLERSIRNLEFEHSTCENGATAFRLKLPLTEPETPWRSCLDGQMGCVIKTYREWKISGDNQWLKNVWPTVKKILEYAWSEENPDEWDRNHDGILEGRQHHTLDVELFGPSSWLQGFYLLALEAAAEMAEFLEDIKAAAEYRRLYENGKKWTNENLFNGKYFIQKIDLNDKKIVEHFNCPEYWNEETGEIKYQIGEGSEIDQMCGQWHAAICGLDRVFNQEKTHIALKNMMQYNYKNSMRNFTNPWRIYALNDEAGSIICDYPQEVQKPKIPICYTEETMSGFEYQFAGLLMSEGFIEEGLKVVKAVRGRYQGYNRNPWNEIECGSNYARSMASFALLPILSGFEYDLPHGRIGFNPIEKKEHFRCMWSLGTGWGNVMVSAKNTTISLLRGELKISSVRLPYIKEVSRVLIDGKEIDFTFENSVIKFSEYRITDRIEVEGK